MHIATDCFIESVGNEPKEILGFDTEEALEQALLELMQLKTD